MKRMLTVWNHLWIKKIIVCLKFRLFLATNLVAFLFTTSLYSQGLLEPIGIVYNNRDYQPLSVPSLSGGNNWLLRQDDVISNVGKFNADNRSDLVVQGQSGLGILTLNTNNDYRVIASVANGTSIPGRSGLGWVVNQNDEILDIGNFFGDARSEILIKSGTQLGIIGLDDNDNLVTITTGANNTYLGDSYWRFKQTDRFLGVGDFNNDNRSDFIIKSDSHMSILSLNTSGNFTRVAIGSIGQYLGDSYWRLKYTDKILGVGDFNNDNHSDFIIQSDSHISILSLNSRNNFTRVAIGSIGQYLGDSYWRLKYTDKILGVGNFDGNNRSDFIIKSDTNISILSLNDSNNFTRVAIGSTGQYLGDSYWRLKHTDKILGIGDFNGNNRSDFIIQSKTHIGLLGVNDAGKFTTISIKDRKSAFAGSYTTPPKSINFKGVGDLNGDNQSDFIIKGDLDLGVFTFKEDINRYKNVDNCSNCSNNQNEEHTKVVNEMLGIKGGDPEGDYITNAVARKPPLYGKNWYPLDGNRKILSGTYSRFGVNNTANIRTHAENDWNIFIVPNDNYSYLISDALPHKFHNLPRHKWQKCGGIPCMEAEITPPVALNNYSVFNNNTGESSLSKNQNICVYGPWVREEVHGNRPEIHPSELIWWESDEDIKVMLMIQDGSDRYDEARNFLNKTDSNWKAWAAAPMIKQFKIAFSVEVGSQTEQYTLNVGKTHLANTFTNLVISQDVLEGRRYGLEKDGEIPILVIESAEADKYLGVTFDSVCYNTTTNRLEGYILVKAQIGEKDKLGAFLEIKLKKETVTIRR